MSKEYLVTYFFMQRPGWGFGHSYFGADKNLSKTDVMRIVRLIKEDVGCDDEPTIINIIELRKEEGD